ncbi:MAG: type I methionyl aminopeptidase [Lentisphaerae bacterium]|jgi:methionyl aminopeptidase|nr:type I methionyl aminopeptidase [Lentisphaerota bacterium]
MNDIIIKTEEEIEIMRQAGARAAEVLRIVCDAVVPGITTKELDDLALGVMDSIGVKSAFLNYMGYPAQTCISINDTIIHGIPDGRKVKDGDVVSVDVGVWYNGFVGDNAKTVAVNVTDPKVLALLENTEKALMAGIKAAKPGNHVGDVSRAVEKVAIDNNLSVVREFVGHGCGRSMHEEPQVPNYRTRTKGALLREGMVFCIEPMFNLGTRRIRMMPDGWTVVTSDGKFSAHFEHMIAITKNGAEILTPR